MTTHTQKQTSNLADLLQQTPSNDNLQNISTTLQKELYAPGDGTLNNDFGAAEGKLAIIHSTLRQLEQIKECEDTSEDVQARAALLYTETVSEVTYRMDKAAKTIRAAHKRNVEKGYNEAAKGTKMIADHYEHILSTFKQKYTSNVGFCK